MIEVCHFLSGPSSWPRIYRLFRPALVVARAILQRHSAGQDRPGGLACGLEPQGSQTNSPIQALQQAEMPAAPEATRDLKRVMKDNIGAAPCRTDGNKNSQIVRLCGSTENCGLSLGDREP